jgi:hypothetical protein
MIVDKNGAINIENLGIVITPEFTLGDLLNNPNSKNFPFRGSNSGFHRYGIRGGEIDGSPFGALLIFYNGLIAQIFISYSGFKSKIPRERTKEQEILTKKKHDEIMIEQHGATEIKYKWGDIGSFMGREGDAQIAITYNNFPIKGRASKIP